MKVSFRNLFIYKNEIIQYIAQKDTTNFLISKLKYSKNNFETFVLVLDNYDFLKNCGITIPEFESTSSKEILFWYIWLLENICLGHKIDNLILDVINILKEINSGKTIDENILLEKNKLLKNYIETSKNERKSQIFAPHVLRNYIFSDSRDTNIAQAAKITISTYSGGWWFPAYSAAYYACDCFEKGNEMNNAMNILYNYFLKITSWKYKIKKYFSI